MEINMAEDCQRCQASRIEQLMAREEVAQKAGTLVAEGSFECPGLRNYAIRGVSYERCRIAYTPPVVSDEGLAQEIAELSFDNHPRPLS